VDYLLCAQLKFVSCALALDQKVFASLWEGFTSLWSFGVRFLDVDFMRINFNCIDYILFFFHSRKGKRGLMHRDRNAGWRRRRGRAGGSREVTRRAFNKRFLLDLAADWQQHGGAGRKHTRVRPFAEWSPHRKTRALLVHVNAVLHE
jgi:hypothetical protein